MTGESGFDGFPAAAPSFLRRLADNNDRNWFRAHRGDYEDFVLWPMRRLLVALAPNLSAIDPGLDTDPRGSAISRIHRDVRFSHDKAPFRINQWLCFKRPGRDWQNRPAFFLEFGPSGYRYGMGCYAAAPAIMAAVRDTIDARPPPIPRRDEAGIRGGLRRRERCLSPPAPATGSPRGRAGVASPQDRLSGAKPAAGTGILQPCPRRGTARPVRGALPVPRKRHTAKITAQPSTTRLTMNVIAMPGARA